MGALNSSKSRGDFAWESGKKIIDGIVCIGVVLSCTTCPNKTFQRVNGSFNAEATAKRFHRDGWDFSTFSNRKISCPRCVTARGFRSHEGEKPVNQIIAAPIPKADPVPPVGALTPDQRRKVREHLDEQFDDVKGQYTAGWSDQEIGRRVNVPWALVKDLREAAYGELMEAPEVAGLRLDIARVEARLTKALDELGSIDATVKELRRQADALKARFSS